MFLFQFSFHYWNFQRPPSVLIFGHFYLLFNRFATETVAWFIALEFVLFLYYVYSYFRIIVPNDYTKSNNNDKSSWSSGKNQRNNVIAEKERNDIN